MATQGKRRGPGLLQTSLAGLFLVAIVAAGPIYALTRAQPTNSVGYVLKMIKLGDGSRVPARWNPCQKAITYKVNVKDLDADDQSLVIGEVKTGFAKLSAVDGVRYRYAGTTSFVPQTDNLSDEPAEIVVAAIGKTATDLDMAESSLGFGGVMWATWSGHSGAGAAVVRGYVVLNPKGLLGLTKGFGAGNTQGNVILHELGHATGLEHVPSTAELMNAVLTGSAPAGYGPGDRAALKKVGVHGGCLKIPSSVGVSDLS